MSKAKIIIEWNGKRYRCNDKSLCHNKRNCDLFRRGICDSYATVSFKQMPCSDICDALVAITGGCPKFCYKEVKAK